MPSRPDPRALHDVERRFPVRVRIRVPDDGFGRRLTDYHEWLWRHVGSGNFALQSDEHGPQNTFNLYLPSVQVAHDFVVAQLDRE